MDGERHLLEQPTLPPSLNSTTPDIYHNGWIAPQWFLSTLNCVAGTAVLLNFCHIVLMSNMRVGMWTAAKNFKAFVIYLAVTDLVLSSGRLCLDHHYVQTYMHQNHWLCVTSATVLHSLNVSQMNLLALASLERFIAVYTGVNYSTKIFVKHYPKILGSFMMLWFALYIVIAILFHKAGYSTQGASECHLASTGVEWLDLVSGVAGLLNLIALILFYTMLLCKSKLMSRKLAKANSKRSAVSKRTARLNTTVGALVITKLVLWSPIILLLILRTVGVHIHELAYVGSICLYLCPIANPILYSCTSSKYRRYLRTTFGCQHPGSMSSSSNGATSHSRGPTLKGDPKILVSAITTPDSSSSNNTEGSEMDLMKK